MLSRQQHLKIRRKQLFHATLMVLVYGLGGGFPYA